MAQAVRQIVWNYQSKTGLKLVRFGRAFGVGHPTVINWREGRTEPETDFLLQFLDVPDWRANFAREILHQRHPERF
jgi:hypothetical protein